MNMYIISRRSGCSYCDILKNWLVARGKNIDIKYAEDNMPFCRENGIKTVPTLVIEHETKEGYVDRHLISGFDSITAYLEV